MFSSRRKSLISAYRVRLLYHNEKLRKQFSTLNKMQMHFVVVQCSPSRRKSLISAYGVRLLYHNWNHFTLPRIIHPSAHRELYKAGKMTNNSREVKIMTASRKSFWITACVVAVCTIISVTALITSHQKSLHVSEPNPASTVSVLESKAESRQSQSAAASEADYLLREYEGKLAIFRYGETAPLQVTDVLIATLPVADQEALHGNGISAHGASELNRLLEDFCS
jgi:hypothetical protein